MAEARHLAEFNIARIRFPLDDPRMAEFVDNVERVNMLAEQIEGFVWRLKDESGHAMNMRVYDDPAILPESNAVARTSRHSSASSGRRCTGVSTAGARLGSRRWKHRS